MILKLKLFAVASQVAGQREVRVEVPEGATIGELRVRLCEQLPALEHLLGSVVFAVNAEYADDSTVLRESDEVACIPPVSGG